MYKRKFRKFRTKIIRKRDGIGKEYYENGNLKFEGEYLNENRNGKGKEYNEDGKLIFEGEYLKGLRKGKGKEYYDNGKILYEGEYLNDEREKDMNDLKEKQNNIII